MNALLTIAPAGKNGEKALMRGLSRLESNRMILRWILASAFLVAGIAHLRSPGTFLLITPEWVPFPHQVILITGVCEIAGALALLTRRFRHAAGVMLAVYALCVFPANVKHAADSISIAGAQLGWSYHGPRLAFQPVIIWWALFAGQVTNWPFKAQSCHAASLP